MTVAKVQDTLARAIDESLKVTASLSQLAQPLERAADLVSRSLVDGHKLLVCGNGGSAADSAHLATEFVCRFQHDRRPYPAIALTDAGSTLSAIGNDYAFDEVFARQVHAFGQPGDVLIVFTTSGKSVDIRKALEAAREHNVATIAFLGKDGGFTRGIADVELLVPCDNTARIQEAQKLLLHVLCETVETRLPR